MPPLEPKATPTTDERLAEILGCLHRMDRRDRLRTIGGFFRSIIALLPIVIFAYGAWYLAAHWDQILSDISSKAASAAAEHTKNISTDALDKLMEQYGVKGQ